MTTYSQVNKQRFFYITGKKMFKYFLLFLSQKLETMSATAHKGRMNKIVNDLLRKW